MTTDRYLQPGWFTRNVFNRLVATATRAGLSIWGSRILQVRGRTSGEIRETPVICSSSTATATWSPHEE